MNGYGLWNQSYELTPAEQAAKKSKSQGFSFSQSTIPAAQSSVVVPTIGTKDPSLDPNYRFTKEGGFAGANAWTIDAQGNVVRPTSQTGATQNFGNYSGPFHDLRNTGQSTASTTANPFSDWTAGSMQHDPQMAYYSSIVGGEFGKQSPAQRRFFETSFDQIYNSYIGELGKQIRANQGKTPDQPLQFEDYLKSDPFTERYSGLTPSERGEYLGRYSPSTRRIYY